MCTADKYQISHLEAELDKNTGYMKEAQQTIKQFRGALRDRCNYAQYCNKGMVESQTRVILDFKCQYYKLCKGE